MSAHIKIQIATSNDGAGEVKLEDKLNGLNIEDKAGPEEEEPEAAGVEEDGQDKRADKKTTTVPHDFMVPCVTQDNETVRVQLALMMQSKAFADMWQVEMPEATREQLNDFTFPMAAVSTPIFKKIVEWMEQHAGKPVPVIELDANTKERNWFTFDEFEQQFFKVDFDELCKLVEGANFLDLKSLYLYGTQAGATVIKERSVEELVQILGLENDLTEAELAEVKAKNVWCLY